MNAIFENTGQALDVCFLINGLEPTQKNSERIALIRILEAVPRLTKQQRAWLEQLVGTRSETVHFDEMTSMEIRGQAALVVDLVRNQLHPAESAAIIGSYTRKMVEKSNAVRYLSEYVKPELTGRDRLIADYAVLRSLPMRKSETYKPRAPETILKALDLKPKEAAAHVREMKKRITPLRMRGEANLEDIFRRDGLVADGEIAYA